MQYYYSMYGSPMVIMLEEKIAEGYNRFVEAFLQAQIDHREEHGTEWNPKTPLWIEATEEDKSAYNAVAGLMNQLIDINGGGLAIKEEDMTSDFLIKQ